MIDKLRAFLKPMVKSFVAVGLVLTLIFAQTGDALAAHSGGRIGGGSFRAPSRGYSAPSGGGYGRGGGYYPGGGLSPLFWFLPFSGGGGGVFSLLIMLAVGGFLLQTFRRVTGGDSFEGDVYNPQVSIAQIQVGLLADARSVQSKLDQLAETVNTDTASGRMHLLQETSLELLRHPEYWTYGKTTTQQAKLDRAEAVFNQLSLNERGKFTTETLSKVNNQLRQAEANPILNSSGELAVVEQEQERAEYIIVTLLVAATRALELPKINGESDLRQALQTLGSVDASALVAIEAIWTPQANGDALTTDDILAHYPDLKLV